MDTKKEAYRRQLWVLWGSHLTSIGVMVFVLMGVLPRLLENPIRPSVPPFIQWIRWGFGLLVIGLWLLGLWLVRSAREQYGVWQPDLSTDTGTSASPPAWFQRALIGWSFFDAGVIVALVYWLLSRDIANVVPALIAHGLAVLWSNPRYITGRVSTA